MSINTTVAVGQKVRVIVEVWTENETPTARNFHEGTINKIIKRSAHSFYLKVSGLDKLIPLDRAVAVKEDRNPVNLSERKKEFIEALERGFDFTMEVFPAWEKDTFFVKNHTNETEYEVNINAKDGQVFASCTCADFKFRKRICKHSAMVLADTFFGIPTTEGELL